MTPQRQSQFTPKMKANAVLHLLSSLVWIDQYNECNGMISFMEFSSSLWFWSNPDCTKGCLSNNMNKCNLCRFWYCKSHKINSILLYQSILSFASGVFYHIAVYHVYVGLSETCDKETLISHSCLDPCHTTSMNPFIHPFHSSIFTTIHTTLTELIWAAKLGSIFLI